MEPILEITSNENLSQRVLDIITENDDMAQKNVRVEKLRILIDEMQLQLKVNTRGYKDVQSKYDESYIRLLENMRQIFKDRFGKSEADGFFNCFAGLMQDSLNLRKMNLIGSKMKIYMERMKTTSFIQLLDHFQQEDDEKLTDLEKTKELFKTSRMICKKVQLSMVKSLEFYKQAHVKQNNLSSLTLGVLTNSVF